jgi:hypothetical protein
VIFVSWAWERTKNQWNLFLYWIGWDLFVWKSGQSISSVVSGTSVLFNLKCEFCQPKPPSRKPTFRIRQIHHPPEGIYIRTKGITIPSRYRRRYVTAQTIARHFFSVVKLLFSAELRKRDQYPKWRGYPSGYSWRSQQSSFPSDASVKSHIWPLCEVTLKPADTTDYLESR